MERRGEGAGDYRLPNIPELRVKKEEKEKKGGALLFPWARLPVSGAPWGSAPGSLLGTFLAGKLGSALVVLAGIGALAGAGAVGFGWFAPSNAGPEARGTGFKGARDGIISRIIVDRPKNKSLSFVAGANRGEILFDPMAAPASKKETVVEKPKKEPKPEAPKPPSIQELLEQARQGSAGTSGKRFGSLTKDVSQLHGGSLALGNKLSNKFGGGMGSSGLGNPVPKFDKNRGKLAPVDRKGLAVTSSKLSTSRGRSRTALGQLRLAKFKSGQGQTATSAGMDEAGHRYSANAFDQASSQGGQLSAIGLNGGSPTVVPPGSGAPDVTAPGAGSPGQTGTPEAALIPQAQAMTQQSNMQKIIAILLIAIGVGLVAAGCTIWTAWLIPIGLALIAAGAMLMMQSQQSGQQALKAVEQISQQDKDTTRSDPMKACVQQALANGTSTDACQNDSQAPTDTGVGQQIDQYDQASDYKFDGQGD